MAEDARGRADGPPPDAEPRRRKKRRPGARRRLFLRVMRRSGLSIFLVVVLVGVVASQTREGQELVLQAALERVRGALSGELIVGGIRSGTLLTGATLTNVRLNDADGGRVLRADSVVLRYSLLAIVRGGPPVRSTVLHGVDIEISRRSEDAPLNVTRLLAPGPPDSTGAERGPLVLGRIGLRHGTVRVLTPSSGASALPTIRTAEGTTLRQVTFSDLDLDLEDAQVLWGGDVAFQAGLASLSGSIGVLAEPMPIREVFGRVSFGDEGIRVADGAFRLPSTLFRGEVVLGPRRPGDAWTLRADLTVDGWGELDDLRWVDDRIPPGRFRGRAGIAAERGVEVSLVDFEAQLEASNVLANGSMRFDDGMSVRSMQVTARPLVVDRLEPWLELDLPFEGWISGQATFSGPLREVTATGRLTFVPTGFGGEPTIADFNGTLISGEDPGGRDLEIRLNPLNYQVLQAFWPELAVRGTGSAQLRLDGRVDGGLSVASDFSHEDEAAGTSRIRANGLLRRLEDGAWLSDLRGDVAPLALGLLAGMAPELSLRGTASGPVRLSGRLDDAIVGGELTTGGGTLRLDGRLDLRDFGAWYRLEAEAEQLPLAAWTAEVPPESNVTGHLTVEGEGLAVDSVSLTASVSAVDSRFGEAPIDSLDATVRIERGVLIADTLEVEVGGVRLAGRGRFGLVEGTWGSSDWAFEADDLVRLRPFVMGVPDSVLVSDGLGELDRQFLRASGIDPDTLPAEADIRMTGVVRGSATVSGSLDDFELGLLVDVVDGAYRYNQVDSAWVAVTASGLPGADRVWGFGARARGIVWDERVFDQAGLEATMQNGAGTGRIEVIQSESEQYRVAGDFRYDDPSVELGLREAEVQVGADLWTLVHPSTVAWDGTSLRVDSLAVERTGTDPMFLTADGVLTRGGTSDFRVDMEGLHLERVVDVGQIAGLDIGGHVDLDAVISGPAEDPLIEGEVRIDGPRYGTVELTRIDGQLEYRDQRVRFELTGWDGGRDALRAAGQLPIDLSLTDVRDRTLPFPMEMTISADSLDAAVPLSYLSSLEQVIGTISGEITVGGTLDAPAPRGSVLLSGAEWTIDAIGVRHTGVSGTLTLNADRTVDVALSSSGVGRSDVTGTVILDPFQDPRLDLTFDFENFQAVERTDVEGRISGRFVLGGTYRRPVATGSLTLSDATIYVDEFQRAAGIVDLTAPGLFDTGLGVDTTALVAQPLIAGLRNPFFDNLRVSIDLAVPRDTWLRSIETNVEMTGDLLVVYDRSQADLVLVGDLEAVRGSHLVLGRNFDVGGGTVSFIGRPGLNPDLDIQASARVRRRESDLQVQATVGGTLIRPIVTLSTEEVGVGQADLVSYLLFGQARGDLASGQSAQLGQIASGAFGAAVAGGIGQLTSQVGAVIAQETGIIDYVSVQSRGGISDVLTAAQVELGWYLADDVFAVLVVGADPEQGDAGSPLSSVRGVRLEWEVVESYRLEAYLEDRFLRSGAAGFILPELQNGRMVRGLFIFREWGY